MLKAQAFKESKLQMKIIVNKIKESNTVKEVKHQFSFKQKILVNCSEPFRPAFIAAVYTELNSPLVIVCPTALKAKSLFVQLNNYLPNSDVLFLPAWESLIFEPLPPSQETVAQRMRVLESLTKKSRFALVLSINSLEQHLPKPEKKVYQPLTLEVGQHLNSDKLLHTLVEKGYQRQVLVEKPGDFSWRGSILDIFPVGGEPIRVDFFGSEIESIKTFDLSEQISKKQLKKVKIYAATEYKVSNDNSLSATNLAPHQLLPKTEQLGLVTDYFSEEPVYVIDEIALVKEAAKKQQKEAEQLFTELQIAAKTGLTLNNYYTDFNQIELKKQLIIATLATKQPDITVNAKRTEPINGRLDLFKEQFWRWHQEKYLIYACLPEKGELQRLKELALDLDIPLAAKDKPMSGLNLNQANVEEGFIFLDAKVVCYGYQDIWPRTARESRQVVQRKTLTFDFSDLKVGDLLVHEVHGIARFGGVLEQEVAGIKREYLLLEYAQGDKLYLPTEQLHKVTRYLGPETSKPPISRLNSLDWLHTKRRVQKTLKKLAVDLLKLYATRAQTLGYAFSPDTTWQKELENAFPYTETKDQQQAVAEVKQDMEKPQPMDRLICGDVGYGKTEVALRAVFKAIMDGKQVLLLAPTTVLVQQHYLNFKERLAPFPVEIAQLSRFLSAKEQKEVVEKIRLGLVDLVIGTHRLLQKDISFKNLGLVIIDEEHRFGVNHKEKLRDLKKSIDVLSMSATPIPRTLQMSLSGVRDISVIETPPEGRRPVLTYIGEYQPSLIAAAIRRELSREGQVFYVANRVQNIAQTALKVQQLVPEAHIGIAHGQMPANQLEKVMLDFLQQKINLLICTTIIESGLDITNANTLIVENADQLGLAQLYQLRGRIGRGQHQGFAYLTYQPGKKLTANALARLKTMGEFTELGSGFKIALKDLEIRGAGNLLGPEQHGHIASVGFDLYCQMLKKEIDNLQHRLPEEVPEVQIDLPVNAFIPKSYIENDGLRLKAYRQIALATTVETLGAIRRELIDKYGQPPTELKKLFTLAFLKFKAAENGVEKIRQLNNRLYLKFKHPSLLSRLPSYLDFFIKGNSGELVIKLTNKQKDVILLLKEIFGTIIPASNKIQRYS